MIIDKYIPKILLLLIIIYFSQDILYTGGGSLIAQAILFAILAISGFYWIKTLIAKTKKPLFYKAWTALLLLNVLGYIFTADFSFSSHFGQFKTILMLSLPFYPFYYFTQKGKLHEKDLIWFFLIMLVVTIAQFYFSRSQILSMRSADSADIVINVAYSFVFLMPFLFLLREKKTLSMLLAFVLVFFIIQGAKRGAIIAGTIGMLYFAYYQLKTVDKKNKTISYLFVLTGVFALVYFGYTYFQQNEFLIQRLQLMSEGDSSGRDTIYSNLFNAWLNSDMINLLLGHGFGSTIFLSGTGNWAHNDWLELLINFGLLGVSIYLVLFGAATKQVFNKKGQIDKKILLLTIVSIWFFTTLVSMNYTTSNSMFQSMMLAYLIGSNTQNQLS